MITFFVINVVEIASLNVANLPLQNISKVAHLFSMTNESVERVSNSLRITNVTCSPRLMADLVHVQVCTFL
jgi:hypothetical protein